ncbi:M14 family zinc carboxypeptidase [Ichthyobacterium seriolicida]|uniref:Peptidase M14 carboxypeptidase A n=1 Tax=Ichthyobacterium seriolicida TaxID=242600 RepID=A0A1J1ECE2_9FLAO|nr:M14 family zinc carboxypeptidase [Ichthyobacterium seriolicida]BAV95176.1 peptidase M14 carboxypeptidase A [Ichthyobacterium seriolicida]
MENELYNINKSYDVYKETSITNRVFKHIDIMNVLTKHENSSLFEIKTIGKSVQGREIKSVSFGRGSIRVMIWSQMHGNEPTGTSSLMDILNFFNSENGDYLLEKLRILIIPMLNPDGAELYQRRNAQGIDINRDALQLQSPEGKILMREIENFNPDFSFNLHDQQRAYSVGNTKETATISFLSPSENYERSITDNRKETMSIICYMNSFLQNFIPRNIGRYTDTFYPTAFGDNLQRWNYKNILIESGGFKNDIDKQQVRKFNFLALLSGFYFIAFGSDKTIDYKNYFNIPNNDKNICDTIVRDVTIVNKSTESIVDIGIMNNELWIERNNTLEIKARIEQIGDLSNFGAYREIDAKRALFKNIDEEKPLTFMQEASFKIGDLTIINGNIV